MKSLADDLPAEVGKQIHPDWRKNEMAYWAARDRLLEQYQGQWVGFADGVVIASGTSPVVVFHAAEQSGRNPFVTCVGRETEPCRMRCATFPYDTSCAGEALPMLDGQEYACRLQAHNELASDNTLCNASPAVSRGQLLLRSNRSLYCIGTPSP